MYRDVLCENPAGMFISFYEYWSVSPLTGGGTFVEAFETICATVLNAIDKLLVAFGDTVFLRIFGTLFLHIFILLYPGLEKKWLSSFRGQKLDALPEAAAYGYLDFGFQKISTLI